MNRNVVTTADFQMLGTCDDGLDLERAADEIADALLEGRTVRAINKSGMKIDVEPNDLRDFIDASALIVARKMRATGSHARAGMLADLTIENAAHACGVYFAPCRVAYLKRREG